MQKIHIIGGGTFSHIRNHLALAAPAFGATARDLYRQFYRAAEVEYFSGTPSILGEDVVARHTAGQEYANDRVKLHLTKMADHNSKIVTNDDVASLLENLKSDPDTRVIILNAALCDFDAEIDGEESGPHATRLSSRNDWRYEVHLTPANKLIASIRKERKDIFVVGFKTTTGETSDSQYRIALNMLKRDSLNLVLANDTVTRNNMIVAPEETRYSETTDRVKVLMTLVKMVLARSSNTFTRSTVVPGEPVPWDSGMIPDNLRQVVDHCIQRGAYKAFRGATAGHFAVKLDEGRILTSKRKRNFNQLSEEGLVLVEYEGDDKVIAHGAKPSVGGQSQRVVFREHPDLDCIVHFHCPPKPDANIATASQWQNECGSHQCGQNTSSNLADYGDLKAVMLEGHGPNIVFSRDTPSEKVIAFIEANFDLDQKTGGLVA